MSGDATPSVFASSGHTVNGDQCTRSVLLVWPMLQCAGLLIELKRRCQRPFAMRTPTSFAAVSGYERIGLRSCAHGIVTPRRPAVAPQPVSMTRGTVDTLVGALVARDVALVDADEWQDAVA